MVNALAISVSAKGQINIDILEEEKKEVLFILD